MAAYSKHYWVKLTPFVGEPKQHNRKTIPNGIHGVVCMDCIGSFHISRNKSK
jgi:hypothetical protein